MAKRAENRDKIRAFDHIAKVMLTEGIDMGDRMGRIVSAICNLTEGLYLPNDDAGEDTDPWIKEKKK